LLTFQPYLNKTRYAFQEHLLWHAFLHNLDCIYY
jgi:hypothetical protein